MMTQPKKRQDTIEKSVEPEVVNLKSHIANSNSMVDLSTHVTQQITKPNRAMRNSYNATQSFGGNSIEHLDRSGLKTNNSILAHDNSLVQIEMDGNSIQHLSPQKQMSSIIM